MDFLEWVAATDDMVAEKAYHIDHYSHLIARSAKWSYKYAVRLGERFLEGEDAILTSPEWTYQYTYAVIQDRWPAGEGTILKSAMWTYEYIYYVMHCEPWPEAEPILLTSAIYAAEYAIHVMYTRWLAAESIIGTDLLATKRYREFINTL